MRPAGVVESEVPGQGPNPALPPPRPTLIPSFELPKATGWAADATPQPAAGLRVAAFARDLAHPRWLHVLPNGDVLVAESAEPPQPDALNTGIRALIRKWAKKRVGAGVPSANRITLLRDTDADGVADQRFVFLEGLNTPTGMALVGERLYVEPERARSKYPAHLSDLLLRTLFPGDRVASSLAVNVVTLSL